MHVVASEVERDQALEDNGPTWERRREEHQQARGRASVRHHVKNGAKARALLVVPRGISVKGVEEAGDAVEKRTGPRVERHVVEGRNGEDDADVAFGESCQLAVRVDEAPKTLRWGSLWGPQGGPREQGLCVPIRLGMKKKMFSVG